ncbi:hypothetical protein T07_4602 [Trichinella nelsoni]|uniref:Uncharacterized protein n=1 Tax=Trichinella nelsoni TaxID=6336 RepID=A0A0V0RKQ0_9BILA|nr:hypothetical protein T07_4602 [Trichinella nelsoni]
MKDTFVANQNAHLEVVLQQMTERVLQAISRFMARQGRPPQWNCEEKRNVWSLATSRRHCMERKLLPAYFRESYMERLVGSMNKSLQYDIIQMLLDEREQLSTWNPTLKYDETHSVVKNHGVLRLI